MNLWLLLFVQTVILVLALCHIGEVLFGDLLFENCLKLSIKNGHAKNIVDLNTVIGIKRKISKSIFIIYIYIYISIQVIQNKKKCRRKCH